MVLDTPPWREHFSSSGRGRPLTSTARGWAGVFLTVLFTPRQLARLFIVLPTEIPPLKNRTPLCRQFCVYKQQTTVTVRELCRVSCTLSVICSAVLCGAASAECALVETIISGKRQTDVSFTGVSRHFSARSRRYTSLLSVMHTQLSDQLDRFPHHIL